MSGEQDEETSYCSNCKRDIATANFVMHEVHCRRNIVLCKHCDEPVPSSELDDHFEEYHAKLACEACKENVEKSKMEDHKENLCRKRPVQCDFCELDFPHCEIAAHRDYCGSRTEQCPLCSQYIMHKDMQLHEDSRCTYPEQKPPDTNLYRDSDQTDAVGFGQHNFAMGEFDRLLRPNGNSSGTRNFAPTRGRLATKSRGGVRNMGTRTGAKRTNERKTRGAAASTSSRTQESLTLPCEFCDELFPAENLIHHQAVCRPETNLYSEAMDTGGPPTDVLNNTRSVEPGHSNEPRILDNLAHLSMQQSVSRDMEGTMLPCEFCDTLLPADVLVQHQAVCDANTTDTPRGPSPAAGFFRPSFRTTPPGLGSQRQAGPSLPRPLGQSPVTKPSNLRPSPNIHPGDTSGVNKWLASDHVRPVRKGVKNVNQTRGNPRMQPRGRVDLTAGITKTGGTNAKRSSNDVTSTDRLSISKEEKTERNMMRSTLDKSSTTGAVGIRALRSRGSHGDAGTSQVPRRQRALPTASVGSGLGSSSSGASGLRVDGGPLNSGARAKEKKNSRTLTSGQSDSDEG